MDFSRYLSLAYPEALIVGVALAWLYARRLANRNVWRTVLVVLAVLLLAYPALVRTNPSSDVYLLVDRSRSIGDEGRRKEQELLGLAHDMLRPGDRLGVVSFNDRPYVEQAAQPSVAIHSFDTPYSEDASDLNGGLETVLSQAPLDRAASILVLSDGEYTGQDPLHAAYVARQQGIPIFYRNLARRELYNLAVRDVSLADKTLSGEPYRVAFRVTSTYATPGRYRLLRDGRPIGATGAAGTTSTTTTAAATPGGWKPYDFKQGENSFEFFDAARQAGIHSYRLEVEPEDPSKETMTRDNAGERYINVIGERPVLVVNGTGTADNITASLTAGGMAVNVIPSDRFHFNIAQLRGFSAVVLNNVPVLGLSMEQLRDLRNAIEQDGGGLVIAGGKRSFGVGGYYRSALEDVIPVSLEDRQQSKKVSTAFSIVMDRSGSMSMKTPSGATKISLAGNAAAESVNLMSEADSLSVVVVDSAPHEIVPQRPINHPDAIKETLRRVESMGGGIFVYTGLKAGGDELLTADQLNKHLLLFADANDSEEPGDYVNLLADYVKAGITVSVVGLGTEHDGDAEFLKDIAKRGNGSIYFTEDAAQLTQFFTADTLTYTRASFVPDASPMRIRPGAFALAPRNTWKDFTAAGYNLTFKRPDAELDIVTADEDQAPILAHWQRGVGRVAALTLDAQGSFSATPSFADIVLAATRWAAGSEVNDNFQIKVAYEGREARISMEIAPEAREKITQAQAVIYGPDGKATTHPMRWESFDRLTTTVRLDQPGLHRGVVQIGDQTYRIGPMSVPVSPEFLYERPPEAGPAKLAELARISGGSEAIDLSPIIKARHSVKSMQPIITPLLVTFLMLMLLEIAEPRFGLIALLRGYGLRARAHAAAMWRARSLRPAVVATAGLAENGTSAAATTANANAQQQSAMDQVLAKTIKRSASSSSKPKAQPRDSFTAASTGGPGPVAGQTTAAKAGAKSEPIPAAQDMDYLRRSKDQARRNLDR